jgi:alpha-tubulin suppressor-like RCC1 family protein/sugar lactone lactonase YvrE
VQVCALLASTCGAVVATLTATYDLLTGKFVVSWHVDPTLDRSLTYRATLFLFNAPVAYSDVKIVDGDVTPLSFTLLVSQVLPLPPSGGSATVGPSGAAIVTTDGAFSLVIPSGALAADKIVTVTPTLTDPATEGTASGGYDLQPDGTTFAIPATVTLAYDPSKILAGEDANDITLGVTENGLWDEVDGATVNATARTVTGPASHFSVRRVISKALGLKPRVLNPRTGIVVVTSTPSVVTVTNGMTFQLSATVTSKKGTSLSNRLVRWPSANPSVATVSQAGVAKAVAPGTAIITAGAGSARSTTTVTVVPPPTITSFTPAANTIRAGGSTTLTAVFANGNGSVTPGAIAPTSGIPFSVAPTQTTTYTLTTTNAAGTTVFATTVVAVTSTSVSAGAEHSVVVKADGTLWAWGHNGYGQVGNGTRVNALIPVRIGNGVSFASAGGYFTVALKTDGTLWGWGRNSSGELGTGTTADALTPVQIGSGFVSVSGGTYHTVAVKSDGTLWAWGWNVSGQLGTGTTTNSLTPVQIGTGFSSVSGGGQHTAALKTDGTLWTWGYNGYGQLGNGTTIDSLTPAQIGGGFVSVSAGPGNTFAVKADGTLWAWGGNSHGSLGDGTKTSRLVPVQIGSGFASPSAGGHTAAVKPDGTLWTWGWNAYGQLGNGTTTDGLIPVAIGNDFVAAAAGQYHTVAVKSDGTIWTWGHNSNGQLGDGTVLDSFTPVPAGPARTITTVAGNGMTAFSGDNGPATSAILNGPIGVAVDSYGNLFIADAGNNRVRRVDVSTRTITTVAGNGISGYGGDNGPATRASLSLGVGTLIALDASKHLFIADSGNNRIRRVDAVTGIITTVAGTGIYGYSGDNVPATTAMLSGPGAVAFDSTGNLFIAEYQGNRIRRVDAVTGVITTVAGNGIAAYTGDNGPAVGASLKSPVALALDRSNNLFISDYRNGAVRRVDATTHTITTVASPQAFGLAFDAAGNLYMAMINMALVQRIDATTGTITTVAGTGISGFSGDNGPPASAQLASPAGIAFDGAGDLLIADYNNQRVRLVTGL